MTSTNDFYDLLKASFSTHETKGERYDRRVAGQFCRALGLLPPAAEDARSPLQVVNEEYLHVHAMALECAKLKTDITLGALIPCFFKSEVWKLYEEFRQNWQRPSVLMVFDRHGDAVGDLVLHNDVELAELATGWLITHSDPGGLKYYIQPWKDVLKAAAELWRQS